nr:SDR family NAD(P)-dependent oxidoreductase [Pseudomonadota bacterium]
ALRRAAPADDLHAARPDDLALLLLTSGSTGLPKAVMLSHRNLLTMAAGTVQMNGFTGDDVTLNWMPLDHVGAISFLGIMAVALGCRQVHAPTDWILKDPLRWLGLIQRHKASISWAPNFAFSLLNDRAAEIDAQPWDLSPLRFLVNAGEQIVARTARHFLRLLGRHGLPADALRPAFGMSETCSGITWSAGFTLDNSADGMAFVELGRPIPGAALRIVDDAGQVVAEGVPGRLQVSGPSVTAGYYQNPERNREAFTADGWFTTGDIGYLDDGRLVLTGRDKDDIIVNGVNYHSHEIEAVVEEAGGVEISYTAACAVRGADDAGDRLAVFFVPAVEDPDWVKALIRRLRGAVAQKVGIAPDYLLPVTRDAIPKTAIGKIQRPPLARRFAAGEFDALLQQFGAAADHPNALPDWFHRRVWRRRRPEAAPGAAAGPLLIFLDAGGLGEALARRVPDCITVEAGAQFARLAPRHYRIGADQPEHYRRLLAELAGAGTSIGAILHLWSHGPRTGNADPEPDLAAGAYSLLHLVQALRDAAPARLLVVSSRSQCLAAGDPLAAGRAALPALVRTIAQESPGLNCRHLDLPEIQTAGDAAAAHADLLLQELGTRADEPEVAWRDGERWVARLAKAEFSPEAAAPLPFADGGLYLITGGLGGIGREIAAYLLKNHDARLLLVGRSAAPDALPPGEILYRAADVADLEALRQAVAAAQARWDRPLAGVIHLAGVFHQRPLAEETAAGLAAALRPKLHGTLALHRLLEDRPEALFIGFSSVNSIFGGAAAGAFAAASRCLDGFLAWRRRHGWPRSYSVLWGPWSEAGINRDAPNREAIRASGYLPIATRQGLASLLVGLRHDQPQLIVGLDGGNPRIRRYIEPPVLETRRLTAYFTAADDAIPAGLAQWTVPDRFQTPSRCRFLPLRELPRTAAGDIDRARLASGNVYGSAAGRAPATDPERRIAAIWQELLGLPEVGLKDNFFELGGHSLLLIQAQSRLQAQFGRPLSLVDMFKYPTVEALAGYLGRAQTAPPAAARLGYDRAKRRAAAGRADIAVIGLACRFPGADSADAFWQNLKNGVESITFFSDAELAASGIDPALLANPRYVKASPVLNDAESFDAEFFGYSAREAQWLDPQQRLLLECAWESLEDAGYDPWAYPGAIGIYAGATLNTYLLNNLHPHRHRLDSNDTLAVTTVDSLGGLQLMVANDKDYLTTRVSYKLNLRGPSVNVQTACSTSLAAIHLAVQGLRAGECDMALAGGVSVRAPQKVGHLYQDGMIVSPDGHCRAFDAAAQGTIFGSGVGLVVLKRLDEALADGDRVYALIKGSAMNNDGGAKVGYMAPSGDGQAVVAAEAIAMAGVDAGTITCVEAHGTATPMGDPIEVEGLSQAFRMTTDRQGYCALGSVKTNVGHLQIASGVAGFIKTVLALHHRQLPPTLH